MTILRAFGSWLVSTLQSVSWHSIQGLGEDEVEDGDTQCIILETKGVTAFKESKNLRSFFDVERNETGVTTYKGMAEQLRETQYQKA